MMSDSTEELATAKRVIRAMLKERPRPTQARIAAATGLTQGGVAKIVKCEFKRFSEGVRRVVEYSTMKVEERERAERAISGVATRIVLCAERLAAADPALGNAMAEFLEKVVGHTAKGPPAA